MKKKIENWWMRNGWSDLFIIANFAHCTIDSTNFPAWWEKEKHLQYSLSFLWKSLYTSLLDIVMCYILHSFEKRFIQSVTGVHIYVIVIEYLNRSEYSINRLYVTQSTRKYFQTSYVKSNFLRESISWLNEFTFRFYWISFLKWPWTCIKIYFPDVKVKFSIQCFKI
jgi:hypothetical protein